MTENPITNENPGGGDRISSDFAYNQTCIECGHYGVYRYTLCYSCYGDRIQQMPSRVYMLAYIPRFQEVLALSYIYSKIATYIPNPKPDENGRWKITVEYEQGPTEKLIGARANEQGKKPKKRWESIGGI